MEGKRERGGGKGNEEENGFTGKGEGEKGKVESGKGQETGEAGKGNEETGDAKGVKGN
jgi:hypothetical protein